MGIDSEFSVLRISFTARSNAGSISVPGLKIGDVAIWGMETDTSQVFPMGGAFEPIVTVGDQLQQTGNVGGLNGLPFDMILLRGV